MGGKEKLAISCNYMCTNERDFLHALKNYAILADPILEDEEAIEFGCQAAVRYHAFCEDLEAIAEFMPDKKATCILTSICYNLEDLYCQREVIGRGAVDYMNRLGVAFLDLKDHLQAVKEHKYDRAA